MIVKIAPLKYIYLTGCYDLILRCAFTVFLQILILRTWRGSLVGDGMHGSLVGDGMHGSLVRKKSNSLIGDGVAHWLEIRVAHSLEMPWLIGWR